MLTEYIQRAMRHTHYELMENNRFFGSIPLCKGAWAEGKALEEIHGLELFTFDLIMDGQSMHLRFPQDDPVRDLRTTALTNALIQRIAEEKSNLSNLNRPLFGVIELYREEENGSLNILPCTLTLSDGSRLNLRGGETVSLRVSPGDISVTAASNDPYSNEAGPEAWRSEKTTFSIAAGEKLRVLIEPAATNSAYTGVWLIRHMPTN